MGIKSMRTSITLTNNDDKKYLTFNSFSNDEAKQSNVLEINNALDNSIVKNFFNTNLKSIRYVKSFIDNNKYRECIEIKNSGDSSLIIISDDVNKYFKEILEFINENRTRIYEKYLFDLICKHEIDEFIFKLSHNGSNSEIKIENTSGKTKIIYSLPYTKNEKNGIIIDKSDVELIQNTINNYFYLTEFNFMGDYFDAPLRYLLSYKFYTDKADITIEGNALYKELELYFGLIIKEKELEDLKERDKNFAEYEKTKNKPKMYLLKPDNNKNE